LARERNNASQAPNGAPNPQASKVAQALTCKERHATAIMVASACTSSCHARAKLSLMATAAGASNGQPR
jgi:hypothetical protein